MKFRIKTIFSIGIVNTIRINFYYLPFSKAIKFPILVSRQVKIRRLKGKLKITDPIKPAIIKFGFDTLGTVDYGHNRAIWEVYGDIVFQGKATLGAATRFVVLPGSQVIISNGVIITGNSSIIINKKLIIGKNCLISWEVQIMDTDFHKIYGNNNIVLNPPKAIQIGDNVWIGSRCTILKGSKIASGCIIAAQSLVTKNLDGPNTIYGGNPIKKLKENIHWEI